MTKQLIKHFIAGFLSVFTFSMVEFKKNKNGDIKQYFDNAARCFNSSLENLKGKKKKNK